MSELEASEPQVQSLPQITGNLACTPELVERRREQFLLHVANGMSLKDAALAVGYSRSTAEQAGRAILGGRRDLLQKALDWHAGYEKIAKRIAEGLDAERTLFFQKDGVVTDQRNVIAWGERREYAALAAKLMDLEPASRNEISGPDGAPIQVAVVHIGLGQVK